MKILHLCLASHYTEGMTYQDNQLPDQNAADGHEVAVVSDCFKYVGHHLEEVVEEDRVLPSGVRLIRFRYDFILNSKISSKIRKIGKLFLFINEFRPDVILFHGAAGYELLTVAKYKKQNHHVKLYVDSHQDFHNSGTFWFSYFFQYKIFNYFIVKKVKDHVDKFLYVSYESKKFLKKAYRLTESELEFYPLGGNVVDKKLKKEYSEDIRAKHRLNDEIMVVHSGKFDKNKKTDELLDSLYSFKNEKIRIFLIGSIPEYRKPELLSRISRDTRVEFLGWQRSDELIKYLCAADLYFQPGTQSATMQNAICCGTPVAIYPYESHFPYIKGNGFFVKNDRDYVDVFQQSVDCPKLLSDMSEEAYDVAFKLLDYSKLAARLYR